MSLPSMNLTNVGPDGEQDPISERVLEIAVAAALVVSSNRDAVAARVSLRALRNTVVTDLSYLPVLLDAVLGLLETAESELGESRG